MDDRASRTSNVASFLSALGGGHQAAFMFDPADREKNDHGAARREAERRSRASEAHRLSSSMSSSIENIMRRALAPPERTHFAQAWHASRASTACMSRRALPFHRRLFQRRAGCSSGWPRPHAHPCDGPGGSGDCRGIGLVDGRGERTVGQSICNTFYQDSRCTLAGCSTVYKDGRFWSGRRAIE